MLIGGNNPDTMFEDYEYLIKTMKEQMTNTKIVLVSHAPTSGEHWGSKNQIFTYNNVKIKKLAEIHGCEFVDIYTPMFDIKNGEIYSNYTTDGAHFTADGYHVVTTEIRLVVDNLLKNYQQ